MAKATTFIISATGSISGIVANVKNIQLNDAIAVKTGKDMEALSLAQLTTIYNNATGKENKKFSIAKDKAIEKVMAALEAMDVTKLVQLDETEQAKLAEAAKKDPAPRKERDSALQKMKRAFLEKTEDGSAFKIYTVKELMEKCNVTEKIAHQYISILRAQNDRFVMNLVKDKDAKTFQFQPKDGTPMKPEIAKHFPNGFGLVAAPEATQPANAPEASAAA